MGKSCKKSRFNKGVIVVDTNRSSAGVQSARMLARYCWRTVGPADLRDANSRREMCAGSDGAKKPLSGLGEGAGVGGEAIGT